MDPVKLALKLVKEDYGSMHLPEIRSREFLSLIKGTRHLARIVTQHYRARPAESFSISFQSDGMASTDKNSNITIPAWYCYKESLEKAVGRELTEKEAAAVSLVLINGSSIHEALHVSLSQKLFSAIEDEVIGKGLLHPLLYTCMQVTEDLKNEATFGDGHSDGLYEYVNAKNEIFFSEKKLNEEFEKVRDEYDDARDIAAYLMCFYKCVGRRDLIGKIFHSLDLDKVTKILEMSAVPFSDSIGSANALYKILRHDDEARLGKEKVISNDESFEEAMQKELASIVEKIATEMEKLEIRLEFNKSTGSVPELVEVNIEDAISIYHSDDERSHSKLDRLDFRFIKELKVSRQIVQSIGEPKKSGSVLVSTRLWRIATDEKVFGRRENGMAALQMKQPQYLLLGDFSGSMRHFFGKIVDALEKISREMTSADIPHSVYGHTSIGDGDIPVVYHIFSYRMRGKTDVHHATKFEMASRVPLRQNYDGHAIAHVANKFNKNTNRVLIVLSDGEPSGPGYSNAVQHTQEVIESVRKKGIKVISLSLVESVINDNDRIYGKEFNVDATNQFKLERGLQKIIMG